MLQLEAVEPNIGIHLKEYLTYFAEMYGYPVAPFLSLLSHADWKTLLRGSDAECEIVSARVIISSLKFVGFPKNNLVPQWLKETLSNFTQDKVREFLIFTTGAPSQPSVASSGDGADDGSGSSSFELLVRCQPKSSSLPTAHTCFFQLDMPMYESQEMLASKLDYAISHARSFDMV